MNQERALEAARRIIAWNAMHGNGENDTIDEVCVARALLAAAEPAVPAGVPVGYYMPVGYYRYTR